MINWLLQYPLFYRLYQKFVRKENNEYDFFKFIFSELKKNHKIKMLDLCSGDSYVLKFINETINEYVGIDNNEKYLKSLKAEWPNCNFIKGDITKLNNLKYIESYKPNLIFMNGAIHHLDDETINSINNFIYKLDNCIFISVDPIRYNNRLLNKIMIAFDRGKFIRTDLEFKKLMKNFDQFIVDDFYQMSFQNVFHYRNIDIPQLYKNWKNSIN